MLKVGGCNVALGISRRLLQLSDIATPNITDQLL